MNKQWARRLERPSFKIKSYGLYKLNSLFFAIFGAEDGVLRLYPNLVGGTYYKNAFSQEDLHNKFSQKIEEVLPHRILLKNILNCTLVHTLKL